MAFMSFVGRVLFVSVFILSAWQELQLQVSLSAPIPLRCVLWAIVLPMTNLIAMEVRELNNYLRLLSIFRFNDFGGDGGPAARALGPKFHVFSKHVVLHAGVKLPQVEMKHLIAASIALKGVGSLLFIIGSSFGAYLLILHQVLATPILYDFYNYDPEHKEFAQLFVKFTQSLSSIGALLLFIGMKNSMPRRQLKKKAPKSKTV